MLYLVTPDELKSSCPPVRPPPRSGSGLYHSTGVRSSQVQCLLGNPVWAAHGPWPTDILWVNTYSNKVIQPLITEKNNHEFIMCPFNNLNSPKLRQREPMATNTSVSCPPAAGSQDHLTRTSLGELSSGSYQNLHGIVALPPLTANTDGWAESTWSFTPLKWTVRSIDVTSKN